MQRTRFDWFPVLIGGIFLLAVTLPYLLAYQRVGENFQFAGFLLNPIDGYSYLAKMHQGWQGEWLFTLPFTVEAGDGGYLFLFYLGLGHLARIFTLSNQLVFHLARITSAALMVASLWYFFGRVFGDEWTRRLAYSLALFGSGLGWLASSAGILSADLWVAEGFPFLSAYANPHFPLGIALMLWFLALGRTNTSQSLQDTNQGLRFLTFAAGLLLAVLLPFGVVITAIVLVGCVSWESANTFHPGTTGVRILNRLQSNLMGSDSGQKLIFLVLGSAPVLIYQVWVTSHDPYLTAWNAQNITLSPPLCELSIAYAPFLLLAIPGIYFALINNQGKWRVLLLWSGTALLLLYIPWNLQRRFITGLLIPLAGLSAVTLELIFTKQKLVGILVLLLLVVLMIPTNLIIILGGIQAVEKKHESVVLPIDEVNALEWIDKNTNQESVILASPDMGLLIPAYTGRKVWYGHPFETPDSERVQSQVLEFFSGTLSGNAQDLILGSDFLFYGNRERALGSPNLEEGFDLLFQEDETEIYRIK